MAYAVIIDVSEDKEIAGIPFLLKFGLSLTTNSAAKCWESAAEPPFPHKKTLPPFLIDFYIVFIDLFISFSCVINFFFKLIDSKIDCSNWDIFQFNINIVIIN